jgi:non-heme chloroperoxidase
MKLLVLRIHRGLAWLAALALGWLCATAHSASTTYVVTAPDGVPIAVQETGNPQGPPIIFVHGLLGSHLSWDAQTRAPELQKYRLITYDLRGHGRSGKPLRPDAYTVSAATGAQKPVLVGWSLGATVITNYLARHGDARIAGAVYVGGVIELAPELLGSHPEVFDGMAADDLRTHLEAQRQFLMLCFDVTPDAPTFQRLLANAALASDEMQRVIHRLSIEAASGLGAMHKPLLLLYGQRDALVNASASIARAQALQPRARALVYTESGHAPFLEEPTRFNHDLAAFVDAVHTP